VDEPEEISDAEFLEWAGSHPQRWAVLSLERRNAWLDHLVARIKTTHDDEQRKVYWQLAYAIASADRPGGQHAQ
jgi:hypothetical protein